MTAKTMIRILGQSRLAWLVFVVGMLLTTLAWYAASAWDEEKSRQTFAAHVNDTLYAVRQRLDAYIDTLYGMRGLFAASRTVTRGEFRRYVTETGLNGHRPGVHSFSFVPYVPAAAKAGFEAAVRGDAAVDGKGNPDFAISPPGTRREYFPVKYVEPEAEQGAELGVDWGVTPNIRQTLERARDSGLPSISERLHGAAEARSASHFFLIVLPIYRNDSHPATVQARRADTVGFVAARVELEGLFKEVVGAGVLEKLFFAIYDGGRDTAEGARPMTAENLLYAEKGGNASHAAKPRFVQRTAMEVAGRNWLFYFGGHAGRPDIGFFPAVIFLGGTLSSMLLFALVLMLVTQRRRVTAEVVRQKSLFSQVLDALPVNVFLKDKDFRFALINEESARTLGIEKDAAIGKTNFDVFPHEVAASLLEYDQYVFEAERLVMREESIGGTGQEKILLAGKKIIRLPGNSEPMLLGFSFDITEHRQAERLAQRFGRLLQSTFNEIYLFDAVSLRFLETSEGARNNLGYSSDELNRMTPLDIWLLPDQADFERLIAPLRNGEQHLLLFDSFHRRKEGTTYPVEVRLQLMQEEPPVFLAIVLDITERLQLEQEMARSRANALSRSLIDAVGEGLIGVDMAHQVVFANPKAQEILGITEAEMLGRKLDEVVHARTAEGDELSDSTCPAWGMISEGRGFQSDDWSFLRGDGSRIPVSLVISPIHDNRENSGSVMSFQDIGLRKTAEERLALVVSQQKAFLNNLPEMAWLKDTESRYILANEVVSTACGLTPEDMVGKTDVDLWPQELAEAYRSDDRLVMANGERKRVVEPFQGVDGARSWIETIKSPIWGGAGTIIGTVGTARDVTDRKRAEEDLLHHMTELARVNAELDEFTYVASHDLQEPVRKLVAFSDLLRKDMGRDLPQLAQQDLTFITDAALRMQRLVKDLLALSRTGKVSMVQEHIRLDDAVDLALNALELRIAESSAQIRRDPLPMVWGDLTLLTQIFQNLIGNALKFVDGPRPEIQLTAEQIEGVWIFGVRDNGIGIDPQYLEQIFQPFKRLHGQGKFEGSGIGLSICRKVVERHRGRIWVESGAIEGAWFKFTLGATGKPADGRHPSPD